MSVFGCAVPPGSRQPEPEPIEEPTALPTTLSATPPSSLNLSKSDPCYAPGACQETRDATSAFTKELRRAIEQGEVNESAEFPPTTLGKMVQKIYLGLVVPQVKSQKRFEAELDRIGWGWVWTPESVIGKKNVSECLGRASQVRLLLAEARREGASPPVTQLLRDLELLAASNEEARRFYRGFASGVKDRKGAIFSPTNDLAFDILEANLAALEEALKFLSPKVGQYVVDSEMKFSFTAAVSPDEIAGFERILSKMQQNQQQISSIADFQGALVDKWTNRMDQALQTTGQQVEN